MQTGDAAPVIVIGGGSLVAPFLLHRLAAAGRHGLCLGRRVPTREAEPLSAGFRFRRIDPESNAALAPPGSAVLSLAPLWALPPLLPRLAGARRIVALGSTSAVVKAASPYEDDRRTAGALSDAEAAIRTAGDGGAGGPAWTILRPTLIHDGETDGTVTAAARIIDRFGLFPILAPAKGLRQPVHADEVALAMLAALDAPEARNRAFDLPGGETLTYRAMLLRIAEALDRRVRLVTLPAPVLAAGLWGTRRLTGRTLSPSLFARMNLDQVFDAGPARAAFGYDPGPFCPRFAWARRASRRSASRARP